MLSAKLKLDNLVFIATFILSGNVCSIQSKDRVIKIKPLSCSYKMIFEGFLYIFYDNFSIKFASILLRKEISHSLINSSQNLQFSPYVS